MRPISRHRSDSTALGRAVGWILLVLLCGCSLSAMAGPADSCVTTPIGLIGWWSGDSSVSNRVGRELGTLEGDAAFLPTGRVGSAFSFGGSNGYFNVPYDSASPLFNLSDRLTFELWVNIPPAASPEQVSSRIPLIARQQCVNAWPSTEFEVVRVGTNAYIHFELGPSHSPSFVDFDSAPLLLTSVWHHIAATYDKSSSRVALYLDGTNVLSGNYSQPVWRPTTPLWIGGIPKPPGTGGACWDAFGRAWVDEVSIYNRALSASEIASIYSAGSSGKCLPVDHDVLFINVHGTSYDGDGFNFYRTLTNTSARATFVNLDANGKVSDLLQQNHYDQVWVFDLSSAADNYPADWAAIGAWYLAHTNAAIVCDGRIISSYWFGRWPDEGMRLTLNYYENIKRAGGGLFLGTDHNDFHAGINSINSAIGLQPFSGNFNLSRIPIDTASPLMSVPNNLGATLFDDSSPGQTPFGLQPNGRILYSVAWHSGNTNTPGISATLRGGVGFRIQLLTPGIGSRFNEESPISFAVEATDGAQPILFQWSSDQDGNLGSSNPLVVSNLTAGTHRITCLATDAASAADSFSFAITVLPVSPELGVRLTPQTDTGVSDHDGITSSSSPAVAFSVNKRGKLELDLNGDGVADETVDGLSAGTLERTLSSLTEGQHSVSATFIPMRGASVSRSFTFTVDTHGPRVVSVSPGAGSILEHALTSVDVTFDEPVSLDGAQVPSYFLKLPAAGETLSLTTWTAISDRVFRFKVPTQRAAGNYELTLQPALRDLAGNFLNQDGDGNNGESVEDAFVSRFSLRLADLLVSEVTLPATARPGTIVPVVYTLGSAGAIPAVGPWREDVSLVLDGAGTVPVSLGSAVFGGTIAVGEQLVRTQLVSIPLTLPAGDWHGVVTVDANDALSEKDESNNSAISIGTLQIPRMLTMIPSRESISESAVPPNVEIQITRNGALDTELVIQLSSSDVTQLTVPATLTIPAGSISAKFAASVLRDHQVRGDRVITLNAVASGYETTSAPVLVLESDQPALALEFSAAQVREGNSVVATVTRQGPVTDALSIDMTTSSPANLTVPTTVLIPAGTNRTTFSIFANEDGILEPTRLYSVSAAARGFQGIALDIDVLDADAPVLVLSLSQTNVTELGGSTAAAGILKRSGSAASIARGLVVGVSSSAPNVVVPATLTFQPGVRELAFPIGVVNNDTVDPVTIATIGVVGLSGGTPLGNSVEAILWVTDDDGPTLTLTLDRSIVAEGIVKAATAVVRRNTSTVEPLTVNLRSDQTQEARVPATVVIPAGQSSATFAIDSIADGVTDGSKTVIITAEATDFSTGRAFLLVTDINLPDLIVSEVSGPPTAFTGQPISLNFRVLNQGLASMTNTVRQRLFLSRDPYVGDDVLVGEQLLNPAPGGGLLPQQSFAGTLTYLIPNASVGDYWIIATCDASGAATEVREDNNVLVSSQPIRIQASYSATVQASPSVAVPGTPILLRGRASSLDGSDLEGRLVELHISVKGVERVQSALIQPDGTFESTFTPLPGEAGHYFVSAVHPGDTGAPIQAEFTLLGARFDPSFLALALTEGENATPIATMKNQSDLPLNGLRATLEDLPSGVTGSADIASVLPANGTLAVQLHLNTSASGLSKVRLVVKSEEGVTVELPLFLTVSPLRPRLTANPTELQVGVLRGGQRTVQFEVRNDGGAASGPLRVLVPPYPWLTVASTNPIPSIPPSGTNVVTLLLTPPADVTLGEFAGSLAVNGSDFGVSIPFKFRTLSEAKGSMLISAADEFTYYAEGNPPVTNAVVTLTDRVTGAVVTNGVTDLHGQFLVPSVLEGYYNVEVSADKHTTFRAPALVEAAKTNDVLAFMSRETVQYVWTVTPTEIEDRTRITIETVFETVVPVPVVTMNPTVIDLANFSGTEKTIELTLENHGLIAARNTRLSFPTHPDWEFLPLVTELGDLNAKSSLKIPLVVRKKATTVPAAPQVRLAGVSPADAGSGPCTVTASALWDLKCGKLNNTYSASTTIINASQNCGGPGGGGGGGTCCAGGGGGFIPGGPGGGGGFVFGNVPIINLPDVCDCGTFPKICLNAEAGLDANSILEELVSKVLSRLPQVQVKEAKLEFKASGNVCSCCKDNQVGWEASGSGEASVSIVLVYGYSGGLEGKIEAAGWSGISASVDALAGVEVTLSGSVKISLDRPCNESPKICISGSAGVGVFAGVRVKGEVSANSLGDNISFSGEVNGAAGISGSLTASVYGCTDGEGPKFELCGNLKLELHLEGELKGVIAGQETTRSFGGNADQVIYDSGCESSGGGGPPTLAGIVPSGAPITEPFDLKKGIKSDEKIFEALGVQPRKDGTCATVRLRLDQDLIQTRDAFKATLELINNEAGPLTEIEVVVDPRDDLGRSATNFFQIRTPVVSGMSGVTGTGILNGNNRGAASWILVPTTDAAPDIAKTYLIGGSLRYRQGGQLVQVPLTPVNITVYPSPRLFVKYFHQRDVFSDDPFTEIIEPSIPYSLAVMVENRGKGDARNVHITSAQPQIVENERGLLIGFEIVASEVEGRALTPSLTVDLGRVAPGTNVIGRWLMTSTLQGLFTDYKASFEHVDGFGNPRLSLIEGVEIHELIHMVRATGRGADARPDFLVNDIQDAEDLPEAVYLSDGSKSLVSIHRLGVSDSPPSSGHKEVAFTTEAFSGFGYLRTSDPQGGSGPRQWKLVAVKRSDGSSLPTDNFWQTDRTFIGQGRRPIYENLLHLFDQDGDGRYTLVYQNAVTTDTSAPSSQVTALPEVSYSNFAVSWTGTDDQGIRNYDIYVSIDGAPSSLWLGGTTAPGAIYPGQPGHRYAFYSVARDAVGNVESVPATPDAVTITSASNRAPIVQAVSDLSLLEGEVMSVRVAASDPDDGQRLRFSLLEGPTGLTVDAANGSVDWATGEATGPADYRIRVRVSDNGEPSLSADVSFQVRVKEVNVAPSLAPIADQIVAEGQRLVVTNSAVDADLPKQSLTWSLGAAAPTTASINSKGLFSWRPSNLEGPSTNLITVIVTDDGVPSLSATQYMKVIVRDTVADVAIRLGSTNVLAGESSSVPIILDSGLPISGVDFHVQIPSGQLGNVTLTAISPVVANSVLLPGLNDDWTVHLDLLPSAGTASSLTLARIAFTATTSGTSTIVPLRVTAFEAIPVVGARIPRVISSDGRILLVIKDPILVALSPAEYVTYGRPAHSYLVQSTASLLSTQSWKPVARVALQDRYQVLQFPQVISGEAYYRAIEYIADPPALSMGLLPGGGMQITVFGQSGKSYRLEQVTEIGNLKTWSQLDRVTLSGDFLVLPPISADSRTRYFRLSE